MAITTIAGAVAGMGPHTKFLKVVGANAPHGIYHSLLYTGPAPAAGVAPSPGAAGAALTSYAGQIPWQNAPAGDAYLGRVAVASQKPGQLIIYDRLWHNSFPAVVGANTINSVAWPARVTSMGGHTVMVGFEFSTANSISLPTTATLTYTNQNIVGGRSGTCTLPGAGTPAEEIGGTFVPFSLQSGDTGVRSIQSVSLTNAQTGGVVHLVAYRVIAIIDVPRASRRGTFNVVTGGFPQLANDTVPCLMWKPGGTVAEPYTIQGRIAFTKG